jgi:hypothetical protein
MRGIIHPRGTGQGDGLFAVHWGKVIQRTPTRLLVTGLEEGLYGNPPRSLRQHKPVILPTSSYFVALRANQESKASAGCNNSILPTCLDSVPLDRCFVPVRNQPRTPPSLKGIDTGRGDGL